jgi:hypothetical protein
LQIASTLQSNIFQPAGFDGSRPVPPQFGHLPVPAHRSHCPPLLVPLQTGQSPVPPQAVHLCRSGSIGFSPGHSLSQPRFFPFIQAGVKQASVRQAFWVWRHALRGVSTQISESDCTAEEFILAFDLPRAPERVRQFSLICLIIASLCCGLSAGPLQPQQLLRIPAQSGQQVSDLKTDSQGNLIVAASVAPVVFSDGYVAGYPTPSYGLVKKMDPQGNEIFSRLLPGASSLKLAIDQNGDIYVGGQTDVPDQFPFTSVLYTPAAGSPGGGFVAKFHGADGTLIYAAELGGVPNTIVVDSSGQALFTMTAFFDLGIPVTFGAYSEEGRSPPPCTSSVFRRPAIVSFCRRCSAAPP